MRAVVVAAMACLLETRASAQVVAIEWPPEAGGAGPFTACVAATLSGDGRVDVAVVSAGTLVVWDAPGAFTAWRLLGHAAPVNDVTVLRRAAVAAPGGADRLVIAAADGLFACDEQPAALVVTPLETGAPWRGARRVLAADLDRDDLDDLLVLRADGRSIDALVQRADGSFGDTRRFEWLAPADVRDLLAAELDGGAAEPELVVDDDGALRILTGGGALLAALPSLRPELDRIARLAPDPQLSAAERIAWVTAASGDPGDPARLLSLVDLAGPQFAAATTFALGPAVAGRFDGDALDDLGFMLDGEARFLAAWQQPGASPFSFGDGSCCILELGGSAGAAAIAPCAADLDGDGQVDLFAPLASLAAVVQLFGPIGDSIAASAPASDFVHDSACVVPIDSEMLAGEARLLALLEGAGALAADPAWHVELLVFQGDATTGAVAAAPFHHCRTPIADLLVAAGADEVELAFACDSYSDDYWIAVRLVELAGDDTVLAAKAQLLGAFSGDFSLAEELKAAGLAFPGWEPEKALLCGAASTSPRIASFIRIRRMPPSVPPPPPKPAPGTCPG